MPLDRTVLGRLLRAQDGVVTRRQLLDLGALPHDLRRLLRRHELSTVHDGVYVDHTGPLTRGQRHWAAVLALAPAALGRESALEQAGLTHDRRGRGDVVHVVVDATRTPTAPRGVKVERVHDAASWWAPARQPPRVTVEFAALKAASGLPGARSVAEVAEVCRQGLTTPSRLLATLEEMPRLPGRRILQQVLADVDSGVHSVLEHRYLVHVERAHGLPRATRQVRAVTRNGVVYRDVRYGAYGVLVELDGRLGHRDTDDRWSDLDRDLLAAAGGELTVRLGWRQVLEPCRVAIALGEILQWRGWAGRIHRCRADTCLDRVALVPPGGT